jgi:hypothetical protein
MSRAITFVLLALFSFPLIAPVLANDATGLPACCRRDGKHHCGMSEASAQKELPDGRTLKAAQSKCPLYPNTGGPAGNSQSAFVSDSTAIGALLVFRSGLQQSSEEFSRIALRGSVQKRGPPSFLN